MKKPKTIRTIAHKQQSPVKGSRPASSSSHVEATQYDPDLGQLTITFRGGRKYRYDGVSKETASGIEGAQSVGGYLHANVIGKHDATKI